MGAEYELTGSQVRWYASNRAFRYRVEVARGYEGWTPTWTVVADRTGNTTVAQTQSDSFSAIGRYVRIYITGVTGGSGAAAISEFRVWGNAPTPPVITPVISGTEGDNGWYVSDVTVSWEVTDPDTAIISADGCETTVIDYDTEGVTLTCTATSSGGTNSESVAIKRDATPPTVAIAGAEDAELCSQPARPTYTASDGLSGVVDQGDSWTTPGTLSGAGSYGYSAWAVDAAGNRTDVSATYEVMYGAAFSGFLPPVRADGTSRFRLGSTVPVKFRLLCGDTPIKNAVARLYVAQESSELEPGTLEPISTAAATTGNLFRYDPAEEQYIFNLSTKSGYTNPGETTPVPFARGPWLVTIALDDGSYHSVEIQLVK